MSTERLLSEFPATSYEEWRALVEKELKGASFEKRLVTKTYEGIDLQPIYWPSALESIPHLDGMPGHVPYLRAGGASGHAVEAWHIAQEIPYATPDEFNQAVRYDLERGQTALNIPLDAATRAGLDPDQPEAAGLVGLGGVSLSTLDDAERILRDIDLEKVHLYVQAGMAGLPVTALLAAALHKKGQSTEKLRGAIEMDPMGVLLETGTLPMTLHWAYDEVATLTKFAIKHAPHMATIAVSGLPYHNAGASAVQELAFMLATGIDYMREMQGKAVSLEATARRMRFIFAVGSNYFMEVAKLRAARITWAKITQHFEVSEEAQRMHIHVRTSPWNKTVQDVHVNMLRATTEAFAGIVGGCDSMHTGFFDEPVRQPDEFSRRIARNIQIILKEEAHLTNVIDPAGGSWYIEALTDQVARQAWALMQQVERRMGMSETIRRDFIQKQIAQTAAERLQNLATRKDVVVGTNKYPNLLEKPLETRGPTQEVVQRERASQVAQYRSSVNSKKLESALLRIPSSDYRERDENMRTMIEAVLIGATLGEITERLRWSYLGQPPTTAPLRIHRHTEIFEELRANAEAYRTKTGARPKVFLANLGPIPQHKGRADFSSEFFRVGGFEVVENNGFPTPEEAAQAALASGAPIVVICSTDDTYPALVPPLTQAIKTAKPDITVILAGYPTDQIEAHKQAGVDDFIHIRSNTYETLAQLQQKIGVVP